jgi:CRP-like cAMP-binding protein
MRTCLNRSTLFNRLEGELLDRLSEAMRPVGLKRNEVLFVQQDVPDGCYCVLDGALKISILDEDGEEVVLAALGAGDVVGEMGLIDEAPRSATVTSLKASELGFLSTAEFHAVAERYPALYRHLLRLVCSRLRLTNDSFTVRQNRGLDGRLAHTLLRLSDGFGNPLEGGRVMIFHKFTQSDLADMVGAARENVSRQLNQWCRDGLLSKISGYYCIEDHAALSTIAGSE